MPDKKKGRRLKASGRIMIEDCLRDGDSLSMIARRIGFSWAAAAHEAKAYRSPDTKRPQARYDRNLCTRSVECQVTDICWLGCEGRCAACESHNCNRGCPDFEQTGQCPRLSRAPYVCNSCQRRFGYGCGYQYVFYDARAADEEARWRRSSTRQGINCTEEQLKGMVAVIKPLLRKGQSLEHSGRPTAGSSRSATARSTAG